MMRCSEEPIPKSLCNFDKNAKDLLDLALQINKDILSYMKLRFHQYPASLASSIIKQGIEKPAIRDEIFLQLVKQTKNNSNSMSASLAFKLLYLCLTCFRPTKQMEDILKSHLASRAVRSLNRFVEFSSIAGATGHCCEALERSLMGDFYQGLLTSQLVEGILVRTQFAIIF
jgi:hypothetical protein